MNEWVVYDSLNAPRYLKFVKPLIVRAKELDPEFNGLYETVNVVKKTGSRDCGLFAIAYLIAIANN